MLLFFSVFFFFGQLTSIIMKAPAKWKKRERKIKREKHDLKTKNNEKRDQCFERERILFCKVFYLKAIQTYLKSTKKSQKFLILADFSTVKLLIKVKVNTWMTLLLLFFFISFFSFSFNCWNFVYCHTRISWKWWNVICIQNFNLNSILW